MWLTSTIARLEDVLPHDELRPFGVPVAQCVRDLPVVVRGDPLLVGRVPDVRLVDQRQLDHPLHHPAQTLAVGRSVDRAVKEEVFLDELADVVVRDRVEAVAALAEQPDLVIRHLRGGEARCVALEQRAELVQVAKILGIVGADDCPPIRFCHDQAVGLQHQQCLAHGRSADPELAGQLLLLQTRPGLQTAVENGFVDQLGRRGTCILDELSTFFEGPRHRTRPYSMQSRS